MGGSNCPSNIAPSHYKCNHVRRTMSLIDASKFIEKKMSGMPVHTQKEWLRMKVPDRPTPHWAFLSIVDAMWYLL